MKNKHINDKTLDFTFFKDTIEINQFDEITNRTKTVYIKMDDFLIITNKVKKYKKMLDKLNDKKGEIDEKA